MKKYHILIFLSLILNIYNQMTSDRAINTCGNLNGKAPKDKDDCKVTSKGKSCCYVEVNEGTDNDNKKLKFCAEINGKMEDDIYNEFIKYIDKDKEKVKIECNNSFLVKFSIFYFIGLLIIFLI